MPATKTRPSGAIQKKPPISSDHDFFSAKPYRMVELERMLKRWQRMPDSVLLKPYPYLIFDKTTRCFFIF